MSTGYRAYWYSPSGKKYKGNSLTGDTFTYSYICKIVNNQLRTGAYLYQKIASEQFFALMQKTNEWGDVYDRREYYKVIF